ncbi:kinetochore-associated protein NSL1 homolog isoform 2-T2 [Syngnathus typhle]
MTMALNIYILNIKSITHNKVAFFARFLLKLDSLLKVVMYRFDRQMNDVSVLRIKIYTYNSGSSVGTVVPYTCSSTDFSRELQPEKERRDPTGNRKPFKPNMAAKMDAQTTEETNEDFRVRLTSKKQVVEYVQQYKDILNKALDGQTGISEDTKRLLLEELLADFEAAVHANVLVNGQTWEEAPLDQDEDKLPELEKRMDDAIVEMTRKRRTLPPQILRSAVRALKAERRLVDFYEKPIKAQQMLTEPQTENLMKDLSDRASELKDHAQVVKVQYTHTHTLEVIDMKPSQMSLEVRQEVFGGRSHSGETPPLWLNHVQGNSKWKKQSVQRDAGDVLTSAGYTQQKDMSGK